MYVGAKMYLCKVFAIEITILVLFGDFLLQNLSLSGNTCYLTKIKVRKYLMQNIYKHCL